jgi:hypothetical protein
MAGGYAASTAEAIEIGAFGSPSCAYRGELFRGRDRLDFLARAVANDGARARRALSRDDSRESATKRRAWRGA